MLMVVEKLSDSEKLRGKKAPIETVLRRNRAVRLVLIRMDITLAP